jgi:hypothetical protein
MGAGKEPATMALWEIVVAVQALKAQVETLEAVLTAEMEKADAHWLEEEAANQAGRFLAEVPF